MNEPIAFRYDRFLNLAGGDLVEYAEPFVTSQARAIPESAYDSIQPELARLDDEHTVYALEICMLLRPLSFAGRIAQFLEHDDSSVCCTAYRLLKAIRPGLVSADLAEQVARTPKVDLFARDVRSGERIFIGTNEPFIRDLVASLVPEDDLPPPR